MNTHTLTNHGDIQKWVAKRHGQPALSRFADTSGRMHARLMLRFERARHAASAQGQNDGLSPCSWTAWLAELDRQNLALRIKDDDYEFVDRRNLN